MRVTVASLLLALVAFGVFSVLRAHAGTRSAEDVLGLPSLSLADVAGGTLNLRSLKGRPLFINLWASWCPPCRAEMPDLQRLYAGAKGSGFMVIGDDQGEGAGPARNFVAQAGVRFPVLLDPAESIAKQFGTDGLPTTLVFDKKGQLVDVVGGMMTAQTMQVELRKALGR